MSYIINAFKQALEIVFSLDPEFLQIISVSLKVSFTSTLLAAFCGVPLGIWVALGKFKGRNLIATILNTLLSLPTVVVGLLLYSFLSRRGPLGGMGLLFTPLAMIMGQFILAFPIIAAFSMAGVRNVGKNSLQAARLLGAGKIESLILCVKETRFIIMASVLAGFGRVFSEVGVSMMLGGNIRFYTRNITTAIALESAKGAFGLGIALGMVLLIIAFLVNLFCYYFQGKNK